MSYDDKLVEELLKAVEGLADTFYWRRFREVARQIRASRPVERRVEGWWAVLEDVGGEFIGIRPVPFTDPIERLDPSWVSVPCTITLHDAAREEEISQESIVSASGPVGCKPSNRLLTVAPVWRGGRMTDNPTCPLCGAGDGSSLSDSLRRMRACLDCDLDAAPPSCESHRAAILAYLTQTYGPEAVSEAWTAVLTKGAA